LVVALVGDGLKGLGRSAFPERRQLRAAGGQSQMPVAKQPPPGGQLGPPSPRHLFIAADGKTIVQVGENLLVVNQLPPYYGWEKFQPIIENCADIYRKLWRPNTIARAAIHYLDRVDITEAEIDAAQYFNVFPVMPDFPGTPATNWVIAYEVRGAAADDILKVTILQPGAARAHRRAFHKQP
jgi:uncharacterized protein (TIGR04255 family)